MRGERPSHRFGKHPSKHDYRALRFRDYLLPSLAAPSPSVNALTRVYAKLGMTDPNAVFPMGGNDTLGDCTRRWCMPSRPTAGCSAKNKQAMVKVYTHLMGSPDTGLKELYVC